MTQKNINEELSFSSPKTAWILVEAGLRGTENQCLGIAGALGLVPEIRYIKLYSPWKQLSPFFRICPEKSVKEPKNILSEPFPDIVIAAGRKAVLPALAIKKKSDGKTFVIFLQDPKIPADSFDIVVAPEHDDVKGDNVIRTVAGLHNVTPKKIEEGRETFAKLYKHLPEPRIGVLIGGTSKTHEMTEEIAMTLAQKLMRLAEKKYGVMITASRRTGKRNFELLKRILNMSRIHFYDGTGLNPYLGILAWADILMVTEDSVSMVSEAVSTGKPVYIIPLKGHSRKFASFHKSLRDKGITRNFEGEIESWTYTPPDDTNKAAAKIRAMIEEKFQIK